MPETTTATETALLRRLVGGDPAAPAEVVALATSSTSPAVLVAAALLTPDAGLLVRAGQRAGTTRDRQLVGLAEARLRGDDDLLDVLVREHLSEHPDNLLAAWIAGGHPHQ